MINYLEKLVEGNSVCILGFGREGRSTYDLLRNYFPSLIITIADVDPGILDRNKELSGDKYCRHVLGKDYLGQLNRYDLIIKSPGITLQQLNGTVDLKKITSQTDIFLSAYRNQVIGITGTKGKSTTSSLIHHIISSSGRNTLLVGNIGLPPFEVFKEVTEETIIVFELSSHQLEVIHKAPHISIILNLFQEHLDKFENEDAYRSSKINITRYQKDGDLVIINGDDTWLVDAVSKLAPRSEVVKFSRQNSLEKGCYLEEGRIKCHLDETSIWFDYKDCFSPRGEHNLANLMAAIITCLKIGIHPDDIQNAICSFKGLRHRLEYVGIYNGITFYNDSIATIPEATIEAVKALGKVDILILGGYDRKLDYSKLISFVVESVIPNVICTGDAGKRIYKGLQDQNYACNLHIAANYEAVFQTIEKQSMPGITCLLSPAAASYDMFRNFEERGDDFCRRAKQLFRT
jgi:UDP-N-acetylmuramoylalanine--D-glutamate ligase